MLGHRGNESTPFLQTFFTLFEEPLYTEFLAGKYLFYADFLSTIVRPV